MLESSWQAIHRGRRWPNGICGQGCLALISCPIRSDKWDTERAEAKTASPHNSSPLWPPVKPHIHLHGPRGRRGSNKTGRALLNVSGTSQWNDLWATLISFFNSTDGSKWPFHTKTWLLTGIQKNTNKSWRSQWHVSKRRLHFWGFGHQARSRRIYFSLHKCKREVKVTNDWLNNFLQ